jgi:type IV secretory pathway TrbD component
VSPRRAVTIVAIWAVATGIALVIARLTKVGPILLSVTTRHGVHAGDAAAFGVTLGVAALVTALLVRRRDGRDTS